MVSFSPLPLRRDLNHFVCIGLFIRRRFLSIYNIPWKTQCLWIPQKCNAWQPFLRDRLPFSPLFSVPSFLFRRGSGVEIETSSVEGSENGFEEMQSDGTSWQGMDPLDAMDKRRSMGEHKGDEILRVWIFPLTEMMPHLGRRYSVYRTLPHLLFSNKRNNHVRPAA